MRFTALPRARLFTDFEQLRKQLFSLERSNDIEDYHNVEIRQAIINYRYYISSIIKRKKKRHTTYTSLHLNSSTTIATRCAHDDAGNRRGLGASLKWQMTRLRVHIQNVPGKTDDLVIFPFIRPEEMNNILFNVELILQICLCRYAHLKWYPIYCTAVMNPQRSPPVYVIATDACVCHEMWKALYNHLFWYSEIGDRVYSCAYRCMRSMRLGDVLFFSSCPKC